MKVFLCALLVALLCLNGIRCCTLDSECGSVDAPGRCIANVCQCGVGWIGNVAVDPAVCSLVCSPLPVPDSVAFLKEPTIVLGASAGNLQLDITQDSYLKQVPTNVAFLNPSNGSSCPLLGNLLGNAVWSQGVANIAGQCDQKLVFSSPFAAQVAAACWERLADTTETGANYAIGFRNFKTQLEVIQSGLAPFGQAVRSLRAGETTITREFRRNYTISVANSFRPNSAPFLVEDTGKIQYRLVVIDYDLLNDKIVAQVETRVVDTAQLSSFAINSGSSGISQVLTSSWTSCDLAANVGFCTQFATVEMSADPCSVLSADLRLDAVFACAGGADPTTCGFSGLPSGNVFVLPNNILTYDACPVVIEYGLDIANSWIRMHSDVARANVLAAAPLLESTIYGRTSLAASGDAVFQSVTMSAVHVWQVASPANLDLGNQKTSTFLTVALDTSTASSPIIDFELTLDPAFFSINNQYYLEAYLDLTFANTGPVTRRLTMPLPTRGRSLISNKRHQEVVYMSRAAATDSPQAAEKGVFTSTFKLKEREQEAEAAPVAPEEGGEPAPASADNIVPIVAGVVGGVALVAAVAVIAVVVIKRRKKQDGSEDSTELDSSDALV